MYIDTVMNRRISTYISLLLLIECHTGHGTDGTCEVKSTFLSSIIHMMGASSLETGSIDLVEGRSGYRTHY